MLFCFCFKSEIINPNKEAEHDSMNMLEFHDKFRVDARSSLKNIL